MPAAAAQDAAGRGASQLPVMVFDLPIHAPEFILRPGLKVGPKLRIDPQQKRLPWGHAGNLTVEGPCVDDRMHLRLAAQHHHQVADHRGAPFVIELHH